MTSYTLSLTRWHKVAERLSRSYTELTQSVKNTFSNTQVNGYLGAGQMERIREKAAIGESDLRKAFAMQDSLIRIRQAIGEANAKTGVTKELAEHDALVRRHKFLEWILQSQSTDMVGIDDMSRLPTQMVSEDRYDRSKAVMRVRVLSTAQENALRKEADELLSKCYLMADRISDLNRERVTLELPEDVARAAGL